MDADESWNGIDLPAAYYKVIDTIPPKRWTEFVRTILMVPEGDISDSQENNPGNVREQRYHMCMCWGTRMGNSASVQKIRNLMNDFLGQISEPVTSELTLSSSVQFEGESTSSRLDRNLSRSPQRDIAIVFNDQVLPQAEIAEQYLKGKGCNVVLVSCQSDVFSPFVEDKTPLLQQASFRVFILTGSFLTLNLAQFKRCMKMLVPRTTALITRRRRENDELPPEMAHLTRSIRSVRTMSGEQLGEIILNFIYESWTDNMDHSAEANVENFDATLPSMERPTTHRQLPENNVATDISVEQSDDFQEYRDVFQKLSFLEGPYDRKHAYILITSAIRDHPMPNIDNIVHIPWVRVFDFDPESRVMGMLSAVETMLNNIRFYTTTDTKDKVEAPDDRVTNWVFINGYSDSPDVTFPMDMEPPDEVVLKHCDSLVNYCKGRKVPQIVVLWYPKRSNCDEILDNFITILRHHFRSQLNSFNCVICVPSKPNKHSAMAHMLKRLKLQDQTAIVPLKILCQWLGIKDQSATQQSNKSLPRFSEVAGEKGSFHLNDKNVKWLNVCFDILSSNDDAANDENVFRDGEDFLKGGRLAWSVVAAGKYDAVRDLLQDAKHTVLKQYIETGKSGIITIFHPPGAGGTTFAKRMLWELRKEAPCLELFSLDISIEDVKDRLRFIRNETHLPVLVLIDGNSVHDVKRLLEFCRYEKVVILNVQRFYSKFKSKDVRTERIWLQEKVSAKEAEFLSEVFSSVKPERKRKLKELTKEVAKNQNHFIFEYGLTAFDSEFRGVKRYVHGNLQIYPQTKLKNWHWTLAYLSLAHYYGHCGLPCKLFGTLLGKADSEVVAIQDLEHSGQKFVSEDINGDWKITYYIVAKEILEQVLMKRQHPEYASKEKVLSLDARRTLCGLSIKFIHFVKENMQTLTHIPFPIQDVLTSIFIKRNYRDAGENDEFGSKSKYSRLVGDMQTEEDKEKILVELVECFPSNAEFHAHLGRFYGITRSFDKAEACLQEAVNVREQERQRHKEKYPSQGDPVLHRIHSMYGFCLNEQVKNEISCVKGKQCKPSSARTILDKAQQAVNHFQLGRYFYQIGCNPTYAFIGEIKLRLQLAEFAHQLSNGNIQKLRSEMTPFNLVGQFVLESFSQCDQLLVQCMYHAEEHNIPQDEFDICVNNFNTFFKNAGHALEVWAGSDETIQSKKCHVAIIKMHVTKGKANSSKFQIYDDVSQLKHLEHLVSLYEGIFNDTHQDGLKHSISNYMLEWLQAIRHPLLEHRDYDLARVKSRIEQWDQMNEAGSLSTFYHYVLVTLLAINGPRGELTKHYSQLSNKLKTKMEEGVPPPNLMERSIEWLGVHENHQSFRNVLHRNLLGEWDGKFWKSQEKISLLKVCKGKIFKCKIWYGHIVMDGGHDPRITVFFNPQRYGFSGAIEKQKARVEFYVAFNPKYGAEAHQLKILEKHNCLTCKTPTEISKLGKPKGEWKGVCPRCDTDVYPEGI